MLSGGPGYDPQNDPDYNPDEGAGDDPGIGNSHDSDIDPGNASGEAPDRELDADPATASPPPPSRPRRRTRPSQPLNDGLDSGDDGSSFSDTAKAKADKRQWRIDRGQAVSETEDDDVGEDEGKRKRKSKKGAGDEGQGEQSVAPKPATKKKPTTSQRQRSKKKKSIQRLRLEELGTGVDGDEGAGEQSTDEEGDVLGIDGEGQPIKTVKPGPLSIAAEAKLAEMAQSITDFIPQFARETGRSHFEIARLLGMTPDAIPRTRSIWNIYQAWHAYHHRGDR